MVKMYADNGRLTHKLLKVFVKKTKREKKIGIKPMAR